MKPNNVLLLLSTLVIYQYPALLHSEGLLSSQPHYEALLFRLNLPASFNLPLLILLPNLIVHPKLIPFYFISRLSKAALGALKLCQSFYDRERRGASDSLSLL